MNALPSGETAAPPIELVTLPVIAETFNQSEPIPWVIGSAPGRGISAHSIVPSQSREEKLVLDQGPDILLEKGAFSTLVEAGGDSAEFGTIGDQTCCSPDRTKQTEPDLTNTAKAALHGTHTSITGSLGSADKFMGNPCIAHLRQIDCLTKFPSTKEQEARPEPETMSSLDLWALSSDGVEIGSPRAVNFEDGSAKEKSCLHAALEAHELADTQAPFENALVLVPSVPAVLDGQHCLKDEDLETIDVLLPNRWEALAVGASPVCLQIQCPVVILLAFAANNHSSMSLSTTLWLSAQQQELDGRRANGIYFWRRSNGTAVCTYLFSDGRGRGLSQFPNRATWSNHS
jgi:hypothetical protein